MADNELLIKINADAKNAQKAFDDIRAKTEDLDSVLSTIGKGAAVAFAALTAEIVLSVKAFGEAEEASKTLNNSLQNQGIYTDELAESYKKYAKAIEGKTGIDDDQIIKSQAIAQRYLGQTKITEELTAAIADYAQVTGDLNSSAEAIAKTIGTNVNAFKRQGLQLSETATEAERYQKVLDFVRAKSGGLAESANSGVGSLKALKTAFGNVQEEIGRNFAPLIEVASRGLTKFLNFVAEHPMITKFAAALLAGATAMAGLSAAIPAIVIGLGVMKAAMAALGVTTNIALGGIPVLVGLVVTALGFLFVYWKEISTALIASFKFFASFVADVFGGIGKIIKAAFTLDSAKLDEGLNQLKNSISNARNEVFKYNQEKIEETKKTEQKQDEVKKQFADKEAADKRAHQARLIAIEKAEKEKLILETQHASEEIIALKEKEISILKALDDEKHAKDKEALITQYEEVKALQEEQRAQDVETRRAFAEEDQATTEEFYNLRGEQLANLNAAEKQKLEQDLLSQREAEKKVRSDILKDRIEVNNKFKEEQIKYGTAIATFDRAVASQQVQSAKTLSGELVALAQSKNSTLKAIGKAAAISQIIIGTAESAVNIARSISQVVPFPLNIPLIATFVGARIAFGAEQIANVTAAQQGGLIEGGIPGRDSVPALLEPGELVVPRRNFNDVVGAVSGGGGNDDMLTVLRSIDAKFSQPQTTVIQGDVHSDESYIDSLTRKISDAIEYRNAKIVGVNT